MINAIRILSLLLPLTLTACVEDDTGPCVHIIKDPILTITGVTESPGGAAVPKVLIDSVHYDDRLVENGYLIGELSMTDDPLSFGLETVNGQLECTPPCGFPGDQARIELFVNTPGYRDTVISVDASFATFHGGCPSSTEDGTEIAIALQRE